MGTLLELLPRISMSMSSLQMILDLLLITLLGVFLVKRPRAGAGRGHPDWIDSCHQTLEESKQIAAELDANLRERQQLIQQLLAKLDLRLDDAKRLSEDLSSSAHQERPPAGNASTARHQSHREVVHLVRSGLSTEAVAKRLGKPVGEVELIAKLHRFSANQVAGVQ
jgi:polyhydroxyalkanoate synthesis regulator phasin